MSILFSDSHTHLYSDQFKGDRDLVIQRALEKGVTQMFLPNVDSVSIDPMLMLAAKYPQNCFPMMGLHPCSVNERVEQELETTRQWLFGAQGKQFAGVGEIGLDYYWDRTFEEQQRDAFGRQIEWAKELGLPIVIHSRDSLHDTIRIVRELKDDRLKGIFHCFNGMLEQAKEIVDLGFYLGIGGVVTFKNSGLDAVVKEIALESLVLETDSPYLAPVPYRGKRNESSYIPLIAQKVADIKEVNITIVAEVTTRNTCKVFSR